MALAFACCALFSYLVLLPQPQNVASPSYITASRSPSSKAELHRIFRQDWGSKVFLATTTVIVAIVYKIPRVYLIVEAFRSTYYLPPESYIATWTSSVSRLP